MAQYPAFERVAQLLRERITAGEYQPGEWLPTERVLSQELNVSRPVLRVALSHLADQGLLIRKRGCRPRVAQSDVVCSTPSEAGLSSPVTPTRTLAVIVPQNPAYNAGSLILHGMNVEFRRCEASFRMLVYDTHSSLASAQTNLEERALSELEGEDLAGLVVWHIGGAETLPLLRKFHDRGLPIVFVDRHPDAVLGDFVGIDNHAGAMEAVKYLLDLGHRRIAYLTSQEDATVVKERGEGYRDALVLAGIEPLPEWTCPVSVLWPPRVGPAVEQFLSLDQPPTAVFAMNDVLAHYLIREVETHGLSVPQDLSVVGFDDLERNSPRPALLTTIRQPFAEMGGRAAKLLLWRLASPEAASQPSTHVLLPAPLVPRSTCQPLDAVAASSFLGDR